MWMRSVQLWEAVPFSVMVTMEGCTIILTIWAKTVMTVDGMSPFKQRQKRTVTLQLESVRAMLLLGFNRVEPWIPRPKLQFSNSWLCHGPNDPNFFLPALHHSQKDKARLEKLKLPGKSKWDNNINHWAVAVELYKGAYIRTSSVSSSPGKQLQVLAQKALLVFSSEPTEHWVVGGILLASASLSVSVWNIIQLGTMKLYPEVEAIEVVTFYSLLGTIQSAILSLFLERNPSAWRLKLNMELLLIILTAIFGGLVRSRVHNWCMSIKGPYYVPLFKPFGIVFATIFGLSLSANSLHYGSVIGSVVIGMGYFVISWGQIREDEEQQDQQCVDERLEPNSERKVPLLQEENDV
ncbi:WAT1-related protein [Prunus yedoensis var. nudiflora]|uniref:WAT1-related protein n=1 Tax=Prunus yedoensis var. nudiflora TaxID=2094558 RepID=A0A314Y736_PRUYE|nr:WAT1-related protein [Prunus yedoensis var. nudiflora]